MKFDKPAGGTPADRMTVLGKPHPRIEGPLKVTGRAPYAYERHDVAPDQLIGYPLGATIAKGRIRSMDTTAARAMPGVVDILTTLDMDALPTDSNNVTSLFGGDEVRHYHQAIAVVVAEGFEQARAAAQAIVVDYAPEKGRFDMEAADTEVALEKTVGDFDAAFAKAAVTVDQTYTTPGQSHAMMEPHASIAAWEGDAVTVWTSNQMIAWGKKGLANTLEMPKDKVRIDSPYIGGGFGGKLFLRADAVLAALAARKVGRAVKVALPRPMMMNNTTHRSATIQRLRIGMNADGRITAIAHDNTSGTLPDGDGEDATNQTRYFYAGDNRLVVNRLATLDLPEANAMRAPGEASGLMALEIAIDEAAEAAGVDPVQFRILNDTQTVPEDPDRTFSNRHFIECLERGAEAFGWDASRPAPATRRDGNWLIGQGVAGAYRGSPVMPSGARVRLQPDGRLIVETDMTDIGTGSYTILGQTAAEMMGVELGAVEVRLGDSSFPVSAGSGGQFGAVSATGGVYAACIALREAVARRIGSQPDALDFRDGLVTDGNVSRTLAEVAAEGEIVAEDKMEFGDFRSKEYELATFAAHFVEVGVDAVTGEVRVRRMLAVADAGRILNPVTAHSQMIGAMTMGLGAALSEKMEVDVTQGFFANHDLAGYEVPVHADIPVQEVIFLNADDPNSSPLKAKGIGELGLCGVAAAIANAVHDATGVRVRDYPVTVDRLIDHLPAA
ncbi:aldehyde oxidoreductase molybdenum-binding subunit PaoC [Falsirhodobacter halotolerans]|uniref:aldehyde oxidoreductase molybdenum-binding subunit PaoC n=1 Tax=Falsirhodobacter halotolerans TaxID=1146892 RepID=UPI001FD3773C|nr:aldehyde oxidoreductase molybdenum-binding subunit PaoC [Falsirhodobacter halotolerans]MCJ8140170.1 xanthine dehydrogenase family protein molybdopterin-binding subunit [Falsirhodobacter halotolerans]